MKRCSSLLAAATATLVSALARAAVEITGNDGRMSRPIDASIDGHRSDWLFNFTTVAISILFVIMVGIILWASVIHRDRPGRKAQYEHGIGRKHLMFTAIVSSIIFFGIDGTLLAGSFVDLTEAFWKFPTKAENPVEIEVLGQQWAWNIRYAGPDGKFNTADDVITLNDMHVPIDRPVYLKIRSKDVIHSFYLPNFRQKIDAFPGSTSQLWFQATMPGLFEIGCAQHCGVSHYKMHGLIRVESKNDYDAWLKQASADSQRRYDETDPTAHWGWDWEM